jgi:hypothetical protein
LYHLSNTKTTLTLPTNDLKKVLLYLLCTQTGLEAGSDGFENYQQAYSYKIEGRRLFKTECDFIGLGSLSVRPGDQVWLIRDSLVQLVLRPVKDTDIFHLVGEARLHGFMYGECWTLDGEWKRKCEQ